MPDQASRMRDLALQARLSGPSIRPRLTAVTSGKGGVGKSTLSLNLAIKLCDAGRQVLLVDADTNLGSLDVMLGIAPRFRLGHFLRGEMELADVLLTAQPGLRLLPASSGDLHHPAMDAGAQSRLLAELLLSGDDDIVLDTGAGMQTEVMEYCRRADDILVVAGPEPTSVMDAYAMMKTIWSIKADAEIRLVLNNVRSPREADETGGKLAMAVQHFLHRELRILGSVPADQAVGKAIIQQQPLVRAFPRSAAALSLQALASQLLRPPVREAERRAVSA